jgi:hypothetical protein
LSCRCAACWAPRLSKVIIQLFSGRKKVVY